MQREACAEFLFLDLNENGGRGGREAEEIGGVLPGIGFMEVGFFAWYVMTCKSVWSHI